MENESKTQTPWACDLCLDSGIDDGGDPCVCEAGRTNGVEVLKEVGVRKEVEAYLERKAGGKCACAAPSKWENGDCWECRMRRLKKAFPLVFNPPRGGGAFVYA